jgi:DNA-binding transcriptional LysR family regulator
LDGAFVAGPVDHPALESRSAFREELVLVTAAGSPGVRDRLARGVLTAIVFRQGCSYRQLLETQFSQRGWVPFQRIEFGTVEGILGCVAADVGVTVLPRGVVARSALRDSLSVGAFRPRPLDVETLFVQRADAPAPAAMRAFVALLAAIGKDRR